MTNEKFKNLDVNNLPVKELTESFLSMEEGETYFLEFKEMRTIEGNNENEEEREVCAMNYYPNAPQNDWETVEAKLVGGYQIVQTCKTLSSGDLIKVYHKGKKKLDGGKSVNVLQIFQVEV